jgi:hypothetical protein
VTEDWIIEWREQLGIRLMFVTRCTHEGADFGPGAVCVTCFDNTQHIGVLVEHLAAAAWDRGREAERRDWEFTADLSTPDEDRQPLSNPYRAARPPSVPETQEPDGA